MCVFMNEEPGVTCGTCDGKLVESWVLSRVEGIRV